MGWATRHGDERAVAPFDNFQIADHKAMIKGDGTEGAEAILRFLHELDSNLSDVHSHYSPYLRVVMCCLLTSLAS